MEPATIHHLRAGIIGTGFIAPVHIEALRRIGVQVTALCGSEAARSLARQWAIPHVFTGYDVASMLASPEVDVVHITSPNKHHYAQASAALQAGKHVICEKPLALNTAETAALVKLAAEHGHLVFAVNYNVRFYPAALQLRADVASGRFGKIIHVNGSYFQDWLIKPNDYNWRLLASEGGELRAVGDVGTHWMDLASFIMQSPVDEVFAKLGTLHAVRQRPLGEVASFAAATGQTTDQAVDTEDFASILLRFSNGSHGNLAVSQVAAGRKNSIRIEIYGTQASASWHSEEPNIIHYGSRDQANLASQRAAHGFQDAAGFTDYPPGHAEGYPDTFKMLYRAVYTDIASGTSPAPLYATVTDAHHELLVCDAILRSHRTRQWQNI